MRDININVSCAHCGELLDTNEATRDDIDGGGVLDISDLEFHVGTQHECFESKDGTLDEDGFVIRDMTEED